ncbi:MAG: N-acetylglucosaminyl-diphospho-decaprenol L-rhamnosyltransferase, partial [Subtercola sp.]|nr:N-acetylglucosaminyl-diphospho-decaprenol L-rhamnosyltransferase [Subtercola sp.]
LAAVGARAIVIGQPRPFGEQEATADALAAAGLAVVAPSWPEASEWPALLARARASTPEWSAWEVAGAAGRAAAVIAEVAELRTPPAAAAAAHAPAAAPAASAATRIAVVTLFSAARLEHARNQFALLTGTAATTPPAQVVGVWLDETPPPAIDGVTIIHQPPGAAGLRLARGRNAGAAAAIDGGADVLVFLDADCLPGPDLLGIYADAAAGHPESVLCGPVTYLPEGTRPVTAGRLDAATAPHPARPNLPTGQTRPATEGEYDLFWSLSFACTARLWLRTGGFDEAYEGYGAEDTDFAARLRSLSVELRWVGGAHAYHQYHPTSSPPWQHLDDILRNAALYRERWGSWPMEGWLSAFAEAGSIALENGIWERTAVRRIGSAGVDNAGLVLRE